MNASTVTDHPNVPSVPRDTRYATAINSAIVSLFHDLLLSPISQHSFWSEMTALSTRPSSPLGHVVVISRQWMHSQSSETTQVGLRDLSRGRALSCIIDADNRR